MDKLYYIRIKYGALLDLLNVLYENAEKIFIEYMNAKKEESSKIGEKYFYYNNFIKEVREQAHILEKEIIEEESKRGL